MVINSLWSLILLNLLKKKYKKNPFLNPYRTDNKFHMQTVGQIMMNCDKKTITIRMDKKHGEFTGFENLLPKDYEPKIKVKIEGEKTHDKGKKLPT